MKQWMPLFFQSALVLSSSIFLLLLILPYPGHAAEADSLRSAVANILERGGLAINTADRREQESPQRVPYAFTTSSSDISAGRPIGEEEDEEASPARNEPVVAGLMVVFVDEHAKALSRDNLPPPFELIDELEDTAGVALHFERAMSLGGFVFTLDKALSQQEFEPILQRLRQLDSVERVAADVSGAVNLEPNDTYIHTQWPLYPTGWPFQELGYAPVVGINAFDAWGITIGYHETIVAVLDTGLIEPVPIASWRVLRGHDFISDPDRARDGDGRDNDPTDMGDHRLQNECEQFPEARDSSWHGTAVTSVLAEKGNDSMGIAGVNWRTSLLPVRVLGKCGGLESDVIDGLLWAAGFSVPGVPDNAYPADIINMSLGSKAEIDCDNTFYPQAIRDVVARGIMIVVSAGNEDSEAGRYAPGNCEGVITAGATDHRGDKASYSNWSREKAIFISAPGGDYDAYGSGAAAMLVAAVDEGDKEPTGELAYRYKQGTSFAAPHVAGVASLALGLDPDQHPQVIASVMALTAQPFAEGSDCEREFPLCGHGIVDAWATLEAVDLLKSYKVVGEFYHAGLEHYFRTGNWDEIDLVLGGQAGAWKPTATCS